MGNVDGRHGKVVFDITEPPYNMLSQVKIIATSSLSKATKIIEYLSSHLDLARALATSIIAATPLDNWCFSYWPSLVWSTILVFLPTRSIVIVAVGEPGGIPMGPNH